MAPHPGSRRIWCRPTIGSPVVASTICTAASKGAVPFRHCCMEILFVMNSFRGLGDGKKAPSAHLVAERLWLFQLPRCSVQNSVSSIGLCLPLPPMRTAPIRWPTLLSLTGTGLLGPEPMSLCSCCIANDRLGNSCFDLCSTAGPRRSTPAGNRVGWLGV
jgi:hypothetical protein